MMMKYLEVKIEANIFEIQSIDKEWFNNVLLLESEESEEKDEKKLIEKIRLLEEIVKCILQCLIKLKS